MGSGNCKELGSSTTAEEVAKDINLEGKNIIVTGCNTGIGLETARVLAARGATIFMACRSVDKSKKAMESILAANKDAKLENLHLDLGNLQSVRNFSQDFNKRQIPLHVLINNAGVMIPPYTKTDDGFELQFGTNHLGHFLLTMLLLESLKRGAPSRVVVLSSRRHLDGHIQFDDLTWEKNYVAMKAYSMSKLANVLFANEFHRRYGPQGICANSLHPGLIATDLARHSVMTEAFYMLGKPFTKTIPQGAATTVYLATAPEFATSGGKYYVDCKEAETIREAKDLAVASKLWEVSEKLVGLVPGVDLLEGTAGQQSRGLEGKEEVRAGKEEAKETFGQEIRAEAQKIKAEEIAIVQEVKGAANKVEAVIKADEAAIVEEIKTVAGEIGTREAALKTEIIDEAEQLANPKFVAAVQEAVVITKDITNIHQEVAQLAEHATVKVVEEIIDQVRADEEQPQTL
eukprot:TRINITY_DN3255_c0_g1_i1.p1 TRINITY_DN3255_c0_g1~~TRINITY_DN3255_c0_g1_i1.p1  ORF type:complete len:460 (-),score=178.42 TRINITY_DN3255_c0_g1_i1:80-1459(-)